MTASSVLASSKYYSPFVKDVDEVIVAIESKANGTANLHVKVSLISQREGDKKVYKSDEYQDMLTELELDVQGIVVDLIVGAGDLEKGTIQKLKHEIDDAIEKRIVEKKKAYFGDKEVNVGCKVTSMYVTGLNSPVKPDPVNRRW